MKINTTTLLLIGVGILGVYLITRPKAPALPVYAPGYNPYATPYTQPNTTAADISAGGQAASSIVDSLSNLFG